MTTRRFLLFAVFALVTLAALMAGCALKRPEVPVTTTVDVPVLTERPPDDVEAAPGEQPGTHQPQLVLQHYGVNPTVETRAQAVSTFAADVDTGSYTLARAYLERGTLPDEAAVRVEEFVNAFDYGYRAPEKEAFAVQVEAFPSPSRKGYHLLHLGVKAREVAKAQRKPSHLVFTIDVSGSMAQGHRLGLVKQALGLLVEELDERDRVSVVVYGDTAQVVLPPTPATEKEVLHSAIARLKPEGSTNVEAGLDLAYELAMKGFVPGGINRVVLCSDGVANNGVSEAGGLWAKVKGRASEGVTLSTVGFGMGHYNDVLMERLADVGDGHYAYVDKLAEARRIFVEQLTGTLQVVAKDVKLQVEFDPKVVERYRLLGFENRVLAAKDFADDKVDAGELGAGHQVTALYEVKLTAAAAEASSFAVFRARYQEASGGASKLVEHRLPTSVVRGAAKEATGPARLSLVAAGFAEKLRGSYWTRTLSWGQLVAALDGLPEGLRARADVVELRALVVKAQRLDTRPDRFEKEAPVASMDFDRLPVLE
ncbi:MAG: von Willebrand factor type A domain-containing protein [Myxococcales bacterium]|nr:von Willebrand factor type A domain-containing protein [Myxococcales bacterium]